MLKLVKTYCTYGCRDCTIKLIDDYAKELIDSVSICIELKILHDKYIVAAISMGAYANESDGLNFSNEFMADNFINFLTPIITIANLT